MRSSRRALPEAITWLVVAAGAATEGLRLGIGTAAKPGPGYVPIIAAAALAVLAVILALQPRDEVADATVSREGRYRALGVVGALVAYAVLLERLGFLLSTFGFVWVLLGVIERRRWPLAVGFAAATAIVAEITFNRWLQAQLPSGLLGLPAF